MKGGTDVGHSLRWGFGWEMVVWGRGRGGLHWLCVGFCDVLCERVVMVIE